MVKMATRVEETVTIRSTVQEIEEKLAQNLNAENVMKRRGPGGTILEYLSSFGSTDELNAVFGNLGWTFTIEQWNKTGEDRIKSKKCKALNDIIDDKNEAAEKLYQEELQAWKESADAPSRPAQPERPIPLPYNPPDVTMIGIECIGRLTVMIGGKVLASKEDVGYGEGVGPNAVRAHADAGKQARSDSLKRCAKDFGYRLGLALYDKTQSHVTSDDKKEEEK